jgi:hypothetical protein
MLTVIINQLGNAALGCFGATGFIIAIFVLIFLLWKSAAKINETLHR